VHITASDPEADIALFRPPRLGLTAAEFQVPLYGNGSAHTIRPDLPRTELDREMTSMLYRSSLAGNQVMASPDQPSRNARRDLRNSGCERRSSHRRAFVHAMTRRSSTQARSFADERAPRCSLLPGESSAASGRQGERPP
jgi:hypothetical protein